MQPLLFSQPCAELCRTQVTHTRSSAKQDQRFLALEVTRLMKDRSSMADHIARLERDSKFLLGERDLLLQQLEGARLAVLTSQPKQLEHAGLLAFQSLLQTQHSHSLTCAGSEDELTVSRAESHPLDSPESYPMGKTGLQLAHAHAELRSSQAALQAEQACSSHLRRQLEQANSSMAQMQAQTAQREAAWQVTTAQAWVQLRLWQW